MDWFYAIGKGILQGATEFIPISSSAHLVLFRVVSDLLGHTPPNPFMDEFFDIVLHIGTLLAVLVYFRAEISRFVMAICQKTPTVTDDNGTIWQTMPLFYSGIIAFMTTSVIALGGLKGSEWLFARLQGVSLFQGVPDLTQFYLVHPQFVAVNLLLTACLLTFAEWLSARRTVTEGAGGLITIQPPQAIAIGFAQAMAALFRGISRSGSTMSMGLMTGLTRQQAARFSFWLSIPIFLSAALYESLKLMSKAIPFETLPWGVILSGLLASFLVGYLCIAWLLRILAQFPLTIFAYYCTAVGVLLLFYFS
jgi:undecaprenyl-diphosphatase